jgi:hypothetical protein
MMSHARGSTSRVELVVHGFRNGQPRAWLMRGTSFLGDKSGESFTTAQVLAAATPQTPLTFTLVPLGTGTRLALDRDSDTFFNQNEIEAGSDPADAAITPNTTTPRLASFTTTAGAVKIEWFGRVNSRYRIQARASLADDTPWADHSDLVTITTNPATWSENIEPANTARFYRIVHVP